MDVDRALARARSAVGKRSKYKLGKGGRRPSARHPWDSRKECDCSGFTAWILGFDRKTAEPFYQNYNNGWVNTDAMWVDAEEPVGIFRNLDGARVGALVVYPKVKRRIGHVGFVSAVNANGVPTSIIHCSSGNYRRSGDAILENGGGGLIAHPKRRYIWFEGLETDAQVLRRGATTVG